MCSLFYLLLSLKKETTLLLMLSVINKLSTLTAPSMINFFFTNINLSNTTKHKLLDSLLQEVTVQIAACLIRPSLHCLIHFYERCVSSVNSLFFINLYNMTKLVLLDSLLQEVRVTEIQLATCLIRLSLYCLIHFSKRFWRPKSK